MGPWWATWSLAGSLLVGVVHASLAPRHEGCIGPCWDVRSAPQGLVGVAKWVEWDIQVSMQPLSQTYTTCGAVGSSPDSVVLWHCYCGREPIFFPRCGEVWGMWVTTEAVICWLSPSRGLLPPILTYSVPPSFQRIQHITHRCRVFREGCGSLRSQWVGPFTWLCLLYCMVTRPAF